MYKKHSGMRGKSVVWCPTVQVAQRAGSCLFHVPLHCSITFGLLECSLCPSQSAGQLHTTLVSKPTGSSDTTVTSVPQMHLLNAEIDISTKAKILCCMFLSCHYIVSYCKIIVCPNLHYKMFFLLKGINIATLYKGSFLDFYFFYIKKSKQWEYHCQIVYKISSNFPCSVNLFLQTFRISYTMQKECIFMPFHINLKKTISLLLSCHY